MFLFVAALVLAATGCSKEEAATNDVQYVSELKINFAGDTKVTATSDASGLKFAWEDGDEIYVFKNIENKTIYGIYKYDKSSNTFKTTDVNAMEAGADYFAVMRPTSTLNESNLGTADVQVELRWDDYSTMKQPPLISDVFKAEADGTIATMHHLMGMVEIPVKLDGSATYTKIDEFFIYDDNVNKIAGSFIATPNGDYFKNVTTGHYYAYLKEAITLNKDNATTIRIPVLPGTHTMKLNYNYTDSESNSNSKQVNLGSITVKRGMITKVPETVINPN